MRSEIAKEWTLRNQPFTIGIAGASCSGKTQLANRLAARLKKHHPLVISMDSYYRDLSDMSPRERERHNFDSPEALELDLFLKHMKFLLSGGEIRVPVYRFGTHDRPPRGEWVPRRLTAGDEAPPVVIVEGLFALYWPEIRDILNLGIFVDADLPVCLSRRIERDTRERDDTYEDVISQFDRFVAPMYVRHVRPTREYADLAVNGESPLDESVDAVLQNIKSNKKKRVACISAVRSVV